jgi:single-strand DNA-binding protein
MSSVNKVILVGRLGTNPELRFTQDGTPVCTMSLATNHSYVDKAGSKQERVSWHRVIAWGKQGEVCKEHLAKGRRIYVEGRLEHRSYTDKSGARRFSTEVISHAVVFLDRQRAEQDRGDPPGEQGAAEDRLDRSRPPSEEPLWADSSRGDPALLGEAVAP